MPSVLKSEWVAPGRGATVRELLMWLGWNVDVSNLERRTELAIVRPGAPEPYDRERAMEALRRAN